MLRRTILHLRLDGLLAAVQAQHQPLLLGQPFVIAGASPGSRVLDVSPGAARLGLMPGIALWQARTMRPEVIVVPPELRAYEEAFARALEVMLRFTPQVKPWGMSEAFLDITASLRLFGGTEGLLASLREELGGVAYPEAGGRDGWGMATYLTFGLGPNPLLARIATLLTAPGGCRVLPPQTSAQDLAALDVSYLWLVEQQKRARLMQMGVRTFGQLQMIPSVLLRREFGDMGEVLFEAARGRDETIIPVYEIGDSALTIRRRTELPRATRDHAELQAAAQALVEWAARSLRSRGESARKLRLALTLANRRHLEGTRRMGVATDQEAHLMEHAASILGVMHLGSQRCVAMELSVGDLQEAPGGHQLSLFEVRPLRAMGLAAAKDRMAGRFSEGAVLPAPLINAAL